MKNAANPLDALARFLTRIFDTRVQFMDLFAVFAGIFVIERPG